MHAASLFLLKQQKTAAARNRIQLFETVHIENRVLQNGETHRLRMPVSNLLFNDANRSTSVLAAPPGSVALSSTITPVVMVPVLSLQSTSMLPRF
jgi:hypothetical protein